MITTPFFLAHLLDARRKEVDKLFLFFLLIISIIHGLGQVISPKQTTKPALADYHNGAKDQGLINTVSLSLLATFRGNSFVVVIHSICHYLFSEKK
jgi:hypothetical protein